MTPAPTFQAQVRDYLEERRRLGFALAIPGAQLMAFARHLDQAGHRGPLTMAAILGWAQGRATRATPFTWARRLDVVRPFARYLARTVPGSAVPERGMFGPTHRRLTPRIYTDAELADLLEAAGRLWPPGTLRPATYRTFFGLVAATGLRLSEALRLCCADVDLRGGVFTVRQTKFVKSRLVPLHPTTAKELIRYDELRRRHVPAAPGARFFVSAKGHFGCTCYHPLFLFNQFGDLERSLLRPGNAHSAEDWRSVLEPVIARYPDRGTALYFRADAAFAKPEIYELLEKASATRSACRPTRCCNGGSGTS